MARDVPARPPGPLRWAPAAAQAGLIFTLSAQHALPRPPGLSPDAEAILGHFTVYAILTAAIWWALPAQRLSPRRRLGLALLGALAYGVTDEWHQSFVPGRDPSPFDLAVDATGAASAAVAIAVAGSVRAREGGSGRNRERAGAPAIAANPEAGGPPRR